MLDGSKIKDKSGALSIQRMVTGFRLYNSVWYNVTLEFIVSIISVVVFNSQWLSSKENSTCHHETSSSPLGYP